ncbi:hypothetical protein S7711_00336 [Stachybotrys chartarum IBT 7711]|uniref:SYO1-like TPR repeats domain-containing protein n=1 Tax=Stachybotrys chartarum (strain CBS 109288 / IBT 7711) TaxID=1280523 RepID=A0A084B9E7_STACB|nr:hypothetical protein S7711_00336 [Stachybotrys chartarum IBT 7711]
MGKSRRNRGHGAHRQDPIVKPVKPPTDPELAALREAKILPVIKDLQSSDPKSRSTAASAISNIIQDTRCRKLLLREQVVHTILRQTLTDAALESRAAGWGILQLLVQEEEADFCLHLYRLDIVTAIEYAAKTVSEKLVSQSTSFSSIPKTEQAFATSIASSLISILTALADSQDAVLSITGSAAITRFLFIVIDGQNSTPDVAALRSDAIACLVALCEDNVTLAESVLGGGDDSPLKTLMSLKDEANGDGVLACAALHGLFASLNGSEHAVDADDSILVPTLAKAIATVTPEQAVANGHGWSSPFEYQTLALEVLASIGTTINSAMGESATKEKEEWGGIEDDEDMGDAEDLASGDEGEEDKGDDATEDDMDEDAMDADMDVVTGDAEEDGNHNIDDLPTLKALLQAALPELLRIARLQPNNDSLLQLQSHALSALNNIAWSLSLVDFSDDNNLGIQRAWTPVARSVWTSVISPVLASDTADLNLAAQVTGLAWAVARSLRGDTPLASDDEHRKFIALYQATKGAEGARDQDDPFQGLGVKCIGVLGQLALHPAPAPRNREIGAFLITLVAGLPETPAADAVEAFNQIFDVYADEEYPYDKEVFWKDNFLKHLEHATPKVRALAKSIDKKSQAELRNRADEVLLNLGPFVTYKQKHKP